MRVTLVSEFTVGTTNCMQLADTSHLFRFEAAHLIILLYYLCMRRAIAPPTAVGGATRETVTFPLVTPFHRVLDN